MTNDLKPDRDPLSWAMPVEWREHFYPLGAHLLLETNSQEILAAFQASFGGYDAPIGPSPDSPLRVLRLFVDPGFDEAPPWNEPVVRGQGDIFFISVGRHNTIIGDTDKGFAFGFLSPAMARDTRWLRSVFLECLVFTILTFGKAGTHSHIHASAVARGEMGLILSGPSRAGKSTLAFACARRGFQVVSDDVVYLREGEDGLTMWGKPWRIRLLTDSSRFFPELKHSAAPLPFDGKECWEIDIEDFLPGRIRTHCRAQTLFFLERTADSASCVPLETERALELLCKDLIYDRPEALERHRRHWLAIAQKGSWILRYGEDLDAAVRLLERFTETGPRAS